MPRNATNKPMVVESEQEVGAAIQAKKKRGLKPASVMDNFHGDKQIIGAAVAKAKTAMKMPQVKDDEECEKRIYEYLDFCEKRNALPKWEELALYLGVVRETLWKWQNGIGCSAKRSHTIKKVKEALASVDADLAAAGAIQPVVYIFRAKNFFGMKDQSEVVLTPNNPLGELQDQKALEDKLVDIVVDE